MTSGEHGGSQKGPSSILRFAPAILILVALASFFAFGLQDYFTVDTLRDNRQALLEWRDANPTLALGIFAAVYAGAVAISFPGAALLTIVGGFLFGLWPGVPAIVIGATAGAFVIYIAAKTALSKSLTKRASGMIGRMEQGFRANELSYMLLLRLIPLFPFWAVNIAAGVIGVRAGNFLIGTFFGIIPGTFVYAGLGATAGEAFDAGETLTLSGLLLKPQTLAIMAVFVTLAIAPIIYKALARPNSNTE